MRSIFVTMPTTPSRFRHDGELRVAEHALQELDLRLRGDGRVVALDELGDRRVERAFCRDTRCRSRSTSATMPRSLPFVDDRAAG